MRLRPNQPEDTLEEWVSNRFGKYLYNQFFKTYTEKVWGVPCTELRADWAAQRIKGLSFFSAAKSAFLGPSASPSAAPSRPSPGRRFPPLPR